jgi:hypothetical protein
MGQAINVRLWVKGRGRGVWECGIIGLRAAVQAPVVPSARGRPSAPPAPHAFKPRPQELEWKRSDLVLTTKIFWGGARAGVREWRVEGGGWRRACVKSRVKTGVLADGVGSPYQCPDTQNNPDFGKGVVLGKICDYRWVLGWLVSLARWFRAETGLVWGRSDLFWTCFGFVLTTKIFWGEARAGVDGWGARCQRVGWWGVGGGGGGWGVGGGGWRRACV